jgi:hypothetical protein
MDIINAALEKSEYNLQKNVLNIHNLKGKSLKIKNFDEDFNVMSLSVYKWILERNIIGKNLG